MSTIRIDSLEWGYAFSYADGNKIELSSDRLTQIIGTNGAGKSSIPLILQEGLYNKNSKGFKKADIPNRHFNKPYYIYIDLGIDDKNYRIEINKASTLKAKLTEDGVDISSNTATKTLATLEELIGMDFKTFVQLIYQSTDSSLEFLTATDSKRKEFLISLFDMAEYVAKQKLFTDALKNISTEVTAIKAKLESEKGALQRNQNILNMAGEFVTRDEPEYPSHLEEEKAKLAAEKSEITKINSQIEKSNKILAELKALPDLNEVKSEYESINVPDMSPFIKEISDAEASIRTARSMINEIKDLGDKCPTCKQDVDRDFINELLKEHTDVETFAKAAKDAATAVIDELKIVKAKKDKCKTLVDKIEQLELQKIYEETMSLKSAESLNESIQEIEDEIAKITAQIKAARAHNEKVVANKAKYDQAQSQIDEIEKAIGELTEKHSKLDKLIGPLETLKKAFGPGGLVAYKLENKVKDLETYTNEYLAKLSDGRFNLSFELNNDKLNVVIYDEQNPVSIVSLSSGERARVIIGTLLGIRKIMQSISKNTLNVLFLDEVISVMDDEGKEQLVEVLLEEPQLNTFLVSHSWTHPLVRKLIVEKEDGISIIRE